MYEIKVEQSFSGAHHLLNYNGVCENQHGHNWKVELYVKGENLDKSNLLIDFKVLKKLLNEILDSLDHEDLNQLDDFKNESPSSEFIAKYIYDKMKDKLPEVSRVAVWETQNSCAMYYEE